MVLIKFLHGANSVLFWGNDLVPKGYKPWDIKTIKGIEAIYNLLVLSFSTIL